jgi:RNA polymerase sigma-70 factor (ECF subfamily)
VDASDVTELEAVVTSPPSAAHTLVVAARDGDLGAFESLLVSRLGRTHRMARAVLGSPEMAGDAVQDAWLTAWRQLPRLREPERFDAWLDRIVFNACRMVVRRHGRMREVGMPEGFDVAAEGDGPDQVVERDILESAFARLTVDQRTILVLHHLEQRPLTVIADVLGIPVGTAKSRLHAARAALDRALEDAR